MKRWVLVRHYEVIVQSEPVEAETKEEAIAKLGDADLSDCTEVPLSLLDEFGEVTHEYVEEEGTDAD